MRLLVLDEEFPWPLNTGKRIRSFNLLSRLARAHDVRYLAYGDASSEASSQCASHGLKPIAVASHIPLKSGAAFYGRLLCNLMSPLPYIVQSHHSRQFQQAVHDALRTFHPDVILCEWTPYAMFTKGISGTPVVVAAHNVETQIWERYAEAERNPFRRWYINAQIPKVRRFEKATFERVSAATAVSRADAQEMARMAPRCNIEVVDNGVDLGYFTSSNPSPNNNTAVFTGSMDWRPNQDAATYFCHDILPLIRKQIPDFCVSFVGRRPPHHIVGLEKIDGVTVTGTVDDVRPYIDDASVYIVPLRIGGGSRLKILEALAMRRAVVSTSVGAEGLQLNHDEHLIVADTPEQFCNQVVHLLGDSAARERLGAAGRVAVEREYGWDALAARLERFLASVVSA